MALIVVTGPPAAGKTTWVRANAQPGDIIIDYDRIAQALTVDGADTHRHSRILARVTFRARSAAINEALRVCDRADVYLIHSAPRPDALARYHQHGARIITIDPGEHTVRARVQADRPATANKAVTRWYATRTTDTEHTNPQASRQW
jgi:predicted kinase